MSLIASPLILCLALAADQPAPKLPVGKDTTYVTGPIDKDGYIDYEAALNERLGKGITPDNNANVLIWKALGPTPEGGKEMPAEFFKQMGMEEPAKDGDYFIPLRQFVKDRLKLDAKEFDVIDGQRIQAGQRPWTAKDYPHIAEWLDANEKPLAVVVEASRRSDYFNPLVPRQNEKNPSALIDALLPKLRTCGELTSSLAARAMLQAGARRFDEAWQDLLACHRLGRLIARGPSLIETLVGVALDAIVINADLQYLENADLSAAQIKDRLKDLQALPPMPSMADKMDLYQRFMYLDTIQLVRRGGADALDALAGGPAPEKPDPEAAKTLAAIDWEPALRAGNRWYDRLAVALRLKDRADREKELNTIEEELKVLKNEASTSGSLAKIFQGKGPLDKTTSKVVGDVLIALVVPAAHKVQSALDRDEQAQRNVQVAFALAAYRRDHGNYPPKLDDLAPRYLPMVPDDLFSGNALVYRPSEKGYLFYSVGVNGKDDGGRWLDDDPPGDDLRVSMPLPELKPKK